MCAIFGLIDYKNHFKAAKREEIIHVLATTCEVRGTDATGYAYNNNGKITIRKSPVPGGKLSIRLPQKANIILGHTRMATQGDKFLNYNNHPFAGYTKKSSFALAHNGIIYNDSELRQQQKLPKTKIKTDSYIAVQLLESYESLTPENIVRMAETIYGSFVFTLLDDKDNSYIVKGNNPLCLCHFPKQGFYIYASTKAILMESLRKLGMLNCSIQEIEVNEGEIIHIDKYGELNRHDFIPEAGLYGYYDMYYEPWQYDYLLDDTHLYPEYITLAHKMLDLGYNQEEVISLLSDPDTYEELYDYYCS